MVIGDMEIDTEDIRELFRSDFFRHLRSDLSVGLFRQGSNCFICFRYGFRSIFCRIFIAVQALNGPLYFYFRYRRKCMCRCRGRHFIESCIYLLQLPELLFFPVIQILVISDQIADLLFHQVPV